MRRGRIVPVGMGAEVGVQFELERLQEAFPAMVDGPSATDWLVDTLRRARLTVLTDAPGAGKARLLRDGVLTRLRRRTDDLATAPAGAAAASARRRATVRPRERVVGCDRCDGSPAEQVHARLGACSVLTPVHLPPDGARPFGAWLVVAAALLAGCAGPRLRGGGDRDGPDPNPPPGLLEVPDAVPTLEPIRAGGANKPYMVWGQSYVPLAADAPLVERGLASWYGRKFSGKPTASGELYDMYAMTAAHPTLPIPSYARIRNPANGREVIVRINDRGPFHSQRIVDVSYTAALKLDILRGATPVELERITADEIRTGAWRHGAPVVVAQAQPARDAAVGVPPARDVPPDPPVAARVPVPADDAVPVSTVPPADAPAAAPPPPIADGAPARAATVSGRGFWVQLGAFRQQAGAAELQRQVESRVDRIAPLLTVFGEASLFRLQAGPYASREDARQAALRLRGALGLIPTIVERR